MIRIYYDEGAERMKIYNGKESIFEGNYWDFSADPIGLSDFLDKISVENTVEEYEWED